MNTVVLFIISVAISHTASERSGMLACNPNDKTKKPVIYAFDGKHLIKDNDPTIPYKHLSSITDQFDVYFAFVPTDEYTKRLVFFNNLKPFFTENKDVISKVIKNIEFLCSTRSKILCDPNRWEDDDRFLYQSPLEKLNFSWKELLAERDKIKKVLGRFWAGNSAQDFVKEAQKTINFVSQKEILYDINTEFYHVKLTLDFEEMRVIEQSSLRIEQIKRTEFVNNTYECQSLGVTVPEIDTSESTTPIGEKNL